MASKETIAAYMRDCGFDLEGGDMVIGRDGDTVAAFNHSDVRELPIPEVMANGDWEPVRVLQRDGMVRGPRFCDWEEMQPKTIEAEIREAICPSAPRSVSCDLVKRLTDILARHKGEE